MAADLYDHYRPKCATEALERTLGAVRASPIWEPELESSHGS